ncbi:cell adhesion molecule CEACAM19-like isoform 2-T2 [Discoglossus pictus]
MTWERGAISRIHWGSRLTVLISLWMDLTSGINIILNPQDPLVGQTVILNVSDVTGRITSFTWYKGLNPNATNQIISYIPGLDPPQTKGDSYIENAQGYDNGSLQIPNLKKEYEGNYTVQIQAGTVQQASVYLPVQVSPNNNGTENEASESFTDAAIRLLYCIFFRF